jgi:hypothetical protein
MYDLKWLKPLFNWLYEFPDLKVGAIKLTHILFIGGSGNLSKLNFIDSRLAGLLRFVGDEASRQVITEITFL